MQLTEIRRRMNLPVIMAPMFLISTPNMVVSACEAGIIGTFPALNARTKEVLDSWMTEINERLQEKEQANPNAKIAPWGVNFISHSSNKRFYEDLELIEKHQPPIVITSLGDPSPVIKVVHSYGGLVLSDVVDIKFAKKALEKGSDGLILVANGAGGHAGTLNPFAFIDEVRRFFDGPVALAGAMTKGEQILAAELLGADFAYIGTHFIATEESGASEAYQESIIQSAAADIIYTPAFSGIPANYLIPSIIKAGLDPENLPKKAGLDLKKLSDASAKAWKDIWGAGQGVGGTTKRQTIQEAVNELRKAYNQAKNVHQLT
ncbi:nitronate monooxygenase family protein [Oceanobacillus sp. CFH 90083]|uniref:NAD(P)H-dependent flavin oxidoreductase n=1 Tax=Oceanobacillus sp. CFH 90083 TaxID=2592336 RepID=UPI00128B9337|nr:nitronate monooxygenase [Oceanobacillus sp. CFH 90083]